MKRATPEGEVLNAIVQYLSAKRVFFWRNNTGATRTASGCFVRYGTPGSPDIVVVKHGLFIGLEVKAENGRQSEDQKAFEMAVTAAGGEYHVVRSIDEVRALGL